MAASNTYICSICSRKIPSNALQLKCDCCLHYVHKNCTNLYGDDLDDIITHNRNWSCISCNENNFPFNQITDEQCFFQSLPVYINHYTYGKMESDKIFIPFELNEEDAQLYPDTATDPDVNFFNEISHQSKINSKYYLQESFLKYIAHVKDKEYECISMMHMNIRSIKANIDSFTAYLDTLQFTFKLIGLTETWLDKNNQDLYSIPGYNIISNFRQESKGGGVSVLLHESLVHKERTDLSLMNDTIECVFTEVHIGKKALIGVIYRPPNSPVQQFNECLKVLLDEIKTSQLPCYLLGDFNINLINHANHNDTGDYLDIMYSNGFIPVNDRPTRVTDHSATLIDHIFTNCYENNVSMYQGILVTDVTDHYPIFHIAHFEKVQSVKDDYYLTRKMNLKNYETFKLLISQYDWSRVTDNDVCQNAFQLFYDNIKSIFDQAFPVKRVKKKYNNRIPWITEALKVSIKTKNRLYVRAKNHDTAYNKMLYANYKAEVNKLLNIQKKKYYNDLIYLYKNNMKKTWETIKRVINKTNQKSKFTQFLVDGVLTEDSKLIAEKFNHYLANIGSDLAKKIPNVSTGFKEFLKGNYAQSLFLYILRKFVKSFSL